LVAIDPDLTWPYVVLQPMAPSRLIGANSQRLQLSRLESFAPAAFYVEWFQNIAAELTSGWLRMYSTSRST